MSPLVERAYLARATTKGITRPCKDASPSDGVTHIGSVGALDSNVVVIVVA